MKALVRALTGSFSWPAGWVLRRIRGAFTGSDALLDVRVRRFTTEFERVQWLNQLRRVSMDAHVSTVLLRLESPPGGIAACQDLRDVVAGLRRSGKKVLAFMQAPTNATLWVAAACDDIIAVPTAEVWLMGMGTEMTFFGAALKRLGLQPDFEAAGEYKSFGEPFTRSFPSAANLEAVQSLLGDVHEQLCEALMEERGLTREQVDSCMEQAPLSAEAALEAGLLDRLLYDDQIDGHVEEQEGRTLKRVEFSKWAAIEDLEQQSSQWGMGDQTIAVVHFDGAIVRKAGMSGGPSIIGSKVVPVLKALREDDEVGAVVLNVNSPGGDALSSDLIWREVQALNEAKPVIACYGDVSASGGVYLSAPAREIFVRPGTITGSIGVFGGKLLMGEGMRRVGIHSHEVLLGPNANLFSPSRPFTDAQRLRFRAQLQRFYDGFVQRVAEGRNLEVDALEPHCRGRVWTGRQAMERGIATRLGSVEHAVDLARSLAGFSHGTSLRVDLPAVPMGRLEKMAESARRQLAPAQAVLLLRWFPRNLLELAGLVVEEPMRPVAMLPFDWEFR